MSKTIKDEAFVVKISKSIEKDKIITLLTKNNGKLEVRAKGITSLISKRAGSIDTGNKVSVAIYETNSSNLLNEVVLLDDFYDIKQDLKTVWVLLYVQEVIEKVIYTYETDLFELIDGFMHELKANPLKSISLTSGLILKMLAASGFEPNLYNCTVCDEPIKPNVGRIVSATGYECDFHKNNSINEIVADDIIKIQRFMLNKGFKDLVNLIVLPEQAKKLLFIHNYWLQSSVDKQLNSFNILIQSL